VGRSIIADAIFIDRFSVLASITVLGAVIVSSILMSAYLQRSQDDGPELFALFLTAAIGAIVMISANDLIVMFLGLEVLSLSLYLLAASNHRREQSQESGIKYFVLGGFASAFFLYGIALVYGSTGSTQLFVDQSLPQGIAQALGSQVAVNGNDSLLLIGIGLLMIGLAFKVSAAPFHVWAPDVYEGAPTPVTAFMASVGKVAAFAALLRVLLVGLPQRVDDWRPVVWALAIATVFIGSVMAVVQTNVKRMLAYSSVSHAGFILVGVEAAGHGLGSGLHSAALCVGKPGVLHGNRTYLLQDENGQISETHSVSAGMDYPGVGPEHAWLKDSGRADYVAITDEEALKAFHDCCQIEGIIPALESAHAIAYACKLAKTLPKDKTILVNLSGRGDKDMHTVAQATGSEG
jgi:NADH:ubiquinone oxidoreductase subunit 2 (subunit N)